MMQVHTRGGSFGPGGYGGGIFDGSQMGFGGMGSYEQAAAGIMGLGDEGPGGVFAWCSKTAPCETGDSRVRELQTAYNRLLSAHGMKSLNVDGKLGPTTCGAKVWTLGLPQAEYNAESVFLKYLDQWPLGLCQSYTYPTPIGGTKPADVVKDLKLDVEPHDIPWMQPNAQIGTVQGQLNEDLAQHGYMSIAETGMLDAPTCGAMKLARDDWGMGGYMAEYSANCQAYTAPRKLAVTPGPGPGPDTHEEETQRLPVKKSGVSAAWMLGGLAVAAGIAGLYAMKKKR